MHREAIIFKGLDTGDISVAASGLRKSYGNLEAVKGIDFEVRRGECFGFLGPNGAGKTTVMKMIYGMAVPSSGKLTVAGLDTKTQEREIKRRIGVVPQQNNLDEELRVFENLLVYGRYFDIPSSIVKHRASELLDFVQLSEKAGARVEHLSGGMKRRLLIARALINEPELLVLDEPTTGLDPQARHLVWEKLRLLRSEGTTLILTTHYMDEAAQLCDRLLIMDHGKVVAEGSPQQLIADHVGPEVLEVRTTSGSVDGLVSTLEAEAEMVELSADTLLAYTKDAEGLLARVRQMDLPVERAVYRPASLEDVFLRLTGRRLIE